MPSDPIPAVESPAWRDGDAIRDAATEVLARPGYDLGRGRELPDAEWVVEWIRWLLTPFRLMFDAMEGLPDGLRWVVVVALLLLLVVLIGHIVWSLSRSLAPPSLSGLSLGSTKESLVDPKVIEQEAQRLAEAGLYVEACRKLLQAALRRLETVRQRRFRPGLTNTELLREYASTPLVEPLRSLVQIIDLKWYGDEPCHPEDFTRCEASHTRIRKAVQEKRDAVAS